MGDTAETKGATVSFSLTHLGCRDYVMSTETHEGRERLLYMTHNAS